MFNLSILIIKIQLLYINTTLFLLQISIDSVNQIKKYNEYSMCSSKCSTQ